MRLAILGTRGIPARYGGFETLAEELSARLAARGHDVTVYTRARYAEPGVSDHRGAHIRVLPTISTKYLDTVAHGLVSGFDAALERFDAVLVCNAINAASSFLPRLCGRTRVVLNVDGLERNRRKWSALGQVAYRISERLSTIVPDAVVSDALVIERYYRERYGFACVFIPYGGDLPRARRDSRRSTGSGSRRRGTCCTFRGSSPRTTRTPSCGPTARFPGQTPLVVVGDAPYAGDYIAQVQREADARVLFPGAIYGEGYRQLLANAAVYVQATEVGGTHPALVEALGYGRVVCYHRSAGERGGRGGGRPSLRRPPAGDAHTAPDGNFGRSGKVCSLEGTCKPARPGALPLGGRGRPL